jgi:hypothetical protein
MILRGKKPKSSENTCPSATLSTTNPTWTDLDTNPGRRGEIPTTKRLSGGPAFSNAFTVFVSKPERMDHLEDLGVAERIILKWILKK